MLNAHYSYLTPQTIQRMQDILTPEEFQGFCRGNIMKYIERFDKKDTKLSNARKILDYACWLNESILGKKISVF